MSIQAEKDGVSDIHGSVLEANPMRLPLPLKVPLTASSGLK
jgi:hypothetical protein